MVKELKKDNLWVKIYHTREEMGAAAGKAAGEKIKNRLAEKREVNVVFAAAPSQNEMLRTLVAAEGIDWTRVNAFHMDEYIGLSPDAPQGFGTFLKELMFSLLPFGSVHYLNGNAPDPQAECQRYSALLRQFETDLVCMGIGENGHIAFNDPWVAHFDDPALVKVVQLDPVCRQQQVNDGCFASLDQVPKTALTLTIPALLRAQHIICTVPAASKKDAVRRCLLESVSEKCPASILRRHPDATLFCDLDSAGGIL